MGNVWARAHQAVGMEWQGVPTLRRRRGVTMAATSGRVALIMGPYRYGPYEYFYLNAQRIVACVNACEGIPTEALEAGVVRELVEALEALVVGLEREIGEEKWGRDPAALPMARAVLAKVWGEA